MSTVESDQRGKQHEQEQGWIEATLHGNAHRVHQQNGRDSIATMVVEFFNLSILHLVTLFAIKSITDLIEENAESTQEQRPAGHLWFAIGRIGNHYGTSDQIDEETNGSYGARSNVDGNEWGQVSPKSENKPNE